MFDVDENANENDSLSEDPTTLDELDEDEVKHDPFEFPHDDKIPFSRLLFDLMVWQVQRSNIGDVNLNMALLENVQVFALPPKLYMLQRPQIKTSPCNQWVPWKWTPLINANTQLARIIISESNAQ
jgi:hypothetical protein